MSGRIVLTRFRLLITSVFNDIGRGRPCSFKNRPQALHRTDPVSSRRHSGVVEVPQFWQVGWVDEDSLLAEAATVGCDAIILISSLGEFQTGDSVSMDRMRRWETGERWISIGKG